jgi:hypothetical protein
VTPLLTCSRTDTLAHALTLFAAAGGRAERVICVDAARRVTGVVSLSDIFAYWARADEDEDLEEQLAHRGAYQPGGSSSGSDDVTAAAAAGGAGGGGAGDTPGLPTLLPTPVPGVMQPQQQHQQPQQLDSEMAEGGGGGGATPLPP